MAEKKPAEEKPAARPLVLDELSHQLDQLRILRKGADSSATERLLQQLGSHDPVDDDLLLQLSARRPLGHPERFSESHSLAMRSVEVLDRNGAREPSLPQLGPLTPIASWVVQQVTRFIVRNHQADVINAICDLDGRRLAWTAKDDPSRPLLLKARLDAARVKEGYQGNPIGVPTFLLGGAVVSVVGQLLSRAGDAVFGSQVAAYFAVAAAFALLAFSSWSILRGAAIAHHRIELTVREPLRALWEVVEHAGKPPEDDAQFFAVIAILLTVIGWLIIPIGVALVVYVF